MKKAKKGLPINKCVEKANNYISQYGLCVLVFDVVCSGKAGDDREKLRIDLDAMIENINSGFERYLPENSIIISTKKSKGFEIVCGDAGCGTVNSEKAVEEIIKYQRKNYKSIKLRWGIAKDGYDKEGMRITY